MLNQQLLKSLQLTYFAFEKVHCESWWNYRNTNSPFTRLFFITDGEAFIKFKTSELHLTPGKLVLVPPFISADYYCPKSFDCYYIMFTAHVSKCLDLFSIQEYDYVVESSSDTEILFKQLISIQPNMGLKIYDHKKPNYNSSIREQTKNNESISDYIKIDGIIRMLISPFLKAKDIHSNNQTKKLKLLPVLLYIDKHLHLPLSLNDLGKVANLNPIYFSNLFTSLFGISPSQYISNKRMERAQFLLLTTGNTIKEIAFNTGYSDPNYFSKAFKKATGTTPGKYRKDSG